MRINVSQLEIDLLPDHSVVLILRCDTAYEAAVTYDEIKEKAKEGRIAMDFKVKAVPVDT